VERIVGQNKIGFGILDLIYLFWNSKVIWNAHP